MATEVFYIDVDDPSSIGGVVQKFIDKAVSEIDTAIEERESEIESLKEHVVHLEDQISEMQHLIEQLQQDADDGVDYV
jgi:prefoldin subunit 5